MSRQPKLQLVQEGTMDGTPQPIVPDVVEPLGQHVLQETPDALVGGSCHHFPALVLGVRVAEAHLIVLGREDTAIGQGDPMDISAEVVQDQLRALHGRFAVDDSPKRYMLFHNKRHPTEMVSPEIAAFLTHLAVDHRVAASTQNRALSALLFLHRDVRHTSLDLPIDAMHATKPKRLPIVLTSVIRSLTARPRRLLRHQRLAHSPLRVGQFMSAHPPGLA
jgi:Phage integrase, N-terminal SAM-like domain